MFFHADFDAMIAAADPLKEVEKGKYDRKKARKKEKREKRKQVAVQQKKNAYGICFVSSGYLSSEIEQTANELSKKYTKASEPQQETQEQDFAKREQNADQERINEQICFEETLNKHLDEEIPKSEIESNEEKIKRSLYLESLLASLPKQKNRSKNSYTANEIADLCIKLKSFVENPEKNQYCLFSFFMHILLTIFNLNYFPLQFTFTLIFVLVHFIFMTIDFFLNERLTYFYFVF